MLRGDLRRDAAGYGTVETDPQKITCTKAVRFVGFNSDLPPFGQVEYKQVIAAYGNNAG